MMRIHQLGPMAAILAIVVAAIVGASFGQRATTYATGTTVVSAKSAAAGTSTVGSLGWHSYTGETGVDLIVPDNQAGYLDLAASAQYLYWESSYYGTMGNGSSTCTGHVYQVWYSNGGPWTAALLLNVVHLKGMTANTFGSANPWGTSLSLAGFAADTQPANCGFVNADGYGQFHYSRGNGWGNSVGTLAGYVGQTVLTTDEVFVGRD